MSPAANVSQNKSWTVDKNPIFDNLAKLDLKMKGLKEKQTNLYDLRFLLSIEMLHQLISFINNCHELFQKQFFPLFLAFGLLPIYMLNGK